MPAGNILVADDDAAIRTVLNQALSRAGYEVRSTSNAATLWRWVSQGEGDLVITDVVMPDENAFDLLPRIKKLRPDLPIVVMSAQNTFMTAIRASDDADQLLEVERLWQVLVRAFFGCSHRRDERVLRAHDDDRQLRTHFLDARQQVEGILVRHHHVGDDEITVPLTDPAPQCRGVAGRADFVAST